MNLLTVDTIEEVEDKLERQFQEHVPAKTDVGLREVCGRYAAEEICSGVDMPQFRKSVMDGYAVIASDTFGVSESIPVLLELSGEVEMGHENHQTLRSGQAMYVPTGGMLPDGANAVVMIEYTEKLDPLTIAVYKPAAPNMNIMDQGDDFRKGQVLFQTGHRFAVKDVGVLAAAGITSIPVFSSPRVALISTGDELIDPTNTPSTGQVRDINSYSLAALLDKAGAEVTSIQILPDRFEPYQAAVRKAVQENDLVVLSGGSSAGVMDLTVDVIDSLGEPGVFTHGIAIKPGKPTILGAIMADAISDETKPTLVVGLPGHPMSAIIVYLAVVEVFLKKHFFHHRTNPLQVHAVMTENVAGGEGRETFQLVRLKQTSKDASDDISNGIMGLNDNTAPLEAVPIHGKSGSILQYREADGYVRISSLSEGIKAGKMVSVTLLNE